MKKSTKATSEQIAIAKDILRRRNIGLLLMAFLVPTVAVIHQTTASNKMALAAGILIIVSIVSIFSSIAFVKCPRCKKRFFTKVFWANGFAFKCVHCELSK